MRDTKKRLKMITVLMGLIIAAGMMFTANISAKAASSDKDIVKQVFDADYYAKSYPDVGAAVGNSYDALLDHYISNGMDEGRNASATFNATAYKNRYSDLSNQYGDDYIKYIRHYVNYGKAEGRDASPAAGTLITTDNNRRSKIVSTEGYTCLGSYTTWYNAKQDRATNVELASSRLNGTIVNPGQEFSFSNTILPRTTENGYVEATVYINKEHARGIGGGVCQVSSTLYACMKTIGLAATERHPHSLPVTYLPEGWDATISGNTLDLKFVNTYDTPLLITSSANNGKLTVSIYQAKK